jgi:hypothetical protein
MTQAALDRDAKVSAASTGPRASSDWPVDGSVGCEDYAYLRVLTGSFSPGTIRIYGGTSIITLSIMDVNETSQLEALTLLKD